MDEDEEDEDVGGEEDLTTCDIFPTTFIPGDAPSGSGSGGGNGGGFPDLEDLRTQVQLADMEGMSRLGTLGRLEMFDKEDDDAGMGPSTEEYKRLEDWLDGGDYENGLEGGYEQLGNEADEETFEPMPDPEEEAIPRTVDVFQPQRTTIEKDEDGFEDDFDDFAAFQSAPLPPPKSATTKSTASLAMDPTPLLLHLQNVRSELSGMENEDERRVRAGREVARVMRDLGMGDGNFSLDGDEDEGEGEDHDGTGSGEFEMLRGL